VTIGNSITSIGNNVFQGCTNLTRITIPKNITSIGSNAFKGCTSLIEVRFEGTILSPSFISSALGVSGEEGYIGDLRNKFYASNSTSGTPGVYTRPNGISEIWTKTAKIITVDLIPEQTYTGSSIYPTVTVKDGTTILTLTTDYTVAYTNNSKAGTATITITGTGNYLGSSVTATFTINPKVITFTVDPISAQTYTGSIIQLAVVVKDDSKTLTLTTDYKVTYTNNTNVGTATVTITGAGNYAGSSATATFTINPKVITFTVDPISAKTYTGNTIQPAVTVKDGSKTLILNTDYKAAYANNTNVGTATVTITGEGNYAGSSADATFTINPKVITFTVDSIPAQTYTGNPILPAVTVKDGSKTLVLTTDYTIAYTNNTNAGTATVTITGVGNYAGSSGNRNFTINALNVTPTVDDFNISGIGTVAYDGSAKTVTITPKAGKSNGTITVKYNGSTVAPSALGTYTVTFDVAAVTGFNAVSGLSAGTLTIGNATPIADDFNISGIGTFAYDGSAKTVTITPKAGKSNGAITVKYNGSTTAPSASGTYNVTFDVAAATNYNAVTGLSAGTLTIGNLTPTATDYNISGIGTFNYDSRSKTVTITPKAGKSNGAITVKYNGSTTAPSAVGTYTVTFDVAAATNYNAVTGLSAGTLTITTPTFTSIAALKTYLEGVPANTANTSYTVVLNVSDLGYEGSTTSLGYVLGKNGTKYVNLDLSGSTITNIIHRDFEGISFEGGVNLSNKNITSVTIPDSVTTIGHRAFSGCESLTAINVGIYNSTYTSQDGVLYNKNKTTLVAYPRGKTDVSFTIPNSVTIIEDGAFLGCSLTSVTIPNSVTSIGKSVFAHCSLTSVTIPNSVTTIGDGAFSSCYSLTSVTIPNSVTTIEYGAFSSCYSLTSVTIPNSVTTIGNLAFRGCSLTNVTIGNSVTSIGMSAFCLTDLTSITIPNSVTSIAETAFSQCTSLTAINVGTSNKIYTSQDGVLYNKNKTTLVIYPSGKTGAFTIPNGVTSIGGNAFNYCTNLTGITIPNSITSIEGAAFAQCTSLTSITIPNSITSIEDMAFAGCTSLTIVTFQGTITLNNFKSDAFGIYEGYIEYIGDLRSKYLAGGIGTYKRASGGLTWTKQ